MQDFNHVVRWHKLLVLYNEKAFLTFKLLLLLYNWVSPKLWYLTFNYFYVRTFRFRFTLLKVRSLFNFQIDSKTHFILLAENFQMKTKVYPIVINLWTIIIIWINHSNKTFYVFTNRTNPETKEYVKNIWDTIKLVKPLYHKHTLIDWNRFIYTISRIWFIWLSFSSFLEVS